MSLPMTNEQHDLRQAILAIAYVIRNEPDTSPAHLAAQVYNKLCDMLPGVTLPLSRPEFFSACGMSFTKS